MAADQPEDQTHPSETVVSILSRSNQQAFTESAKPCLLSCTETACWWGLRLLKTLKVKIIAIYLQQLWDVQYCQKLLARYLGKLRGLVHCLSNDGGEFLCNKKWLTTETTIQVPTSLLPSMHKESSTLQHPPEYSYLMRPPKTSIKKHSDEEFPCLFEGHLIPYSWVHDPS